MVTCYTQYFPAPYLIVKSKIPFALIWTSLVLQPVTPSLKHLLRTYFGRKIRKMKTIKYFVCSEMIIVTLSHAVLRNISYKLQAGKTNYSNIHSDGRLPRQKGKKTDWEMFLQCELLHRKSSAIYHLFIFSLSKSREGEKLVRAGDYCVFEKLL